MIGSDAYGSSRGSGFVRGRHVPEFRGCFGDAEECRQPHAGLGQGLQVVREDAVERGARLVVCARFGGE